MINNSAEASSSKQCEIWFQRMLTAIYWREPMYNIDNFKYLLNTHCVFIEPTYILYGVHCRQRR